MDKIIRAVLIDLSGTIHIEDQCIEGALQSIRILMNHPNFQVHFVSNTTKQSRQSLLKGLNALGFNITSEHVTTSLSASIDLLKTLHIRKPYLLVSEDASEEFLKAGFDGKPMDNGEHDAVVVGLAPQAFDYIHLNKAFRILHRLREVGETSNNPCLIAIHKGRYFATKEGMSLGPGPFVSALEYATGISALVVGKPSRTFFHQILERLQVKPHHAVMIGDDRYDDVLGAQQAGLRGWLVKTGKYEETGDIRNEPAPDRIFNSVVQAIEYLLQEFGTNQT